MKNYFTISGKSMSPIIEDGDLIYFVKQNEVKRGDIVLFIQKNKMLAHRIIKKKEGLVLTKGDNARTADEILKLGDIIGKVTRVKNQHKDIDFKSRWTNLIQRYLLLSSMAVYISPQPIKDFIRKLFRGKKILVRLIS